jgi:hypothetical protein
VQDQFCIQTRLGLTRRSRAMKIVYCVQAQLQTSVFKCKNKKILHNRTGTYDSSVEIGSMHVVMRTAKDIRKE